MGLISRYGQKFVSMDEERPSACVSPTAESLSLITSALTLSGSLCVEEEHNK